jgi:NADH-quinone oxidoreductase subunit I
MLGEGIIRGMVETARNFAGSYVSKDRLPTLQYPEQRQALAESVRTFPFLVHDGEDPVKGLRCVACQICEKECPPQCIFVIKDTVKKPDFKGQPQFQPKVFNIDLSVCMGCGICAEVCPFDSIKMDTVFEITAGDRFQGLLMDKQRLARSNAYFRQQHPTEAAGADARLATDKARFEAKLKADAEARARAAAGAGQNSSAR